MRLPERTAMMVSGIVFFAVVVAVQSPVFANQQSHALYAHGLVPFNNGQWEQAHQLFDRAVRADPADALATYYRGLAQARRGDGAAAIQDFRKALQIEPSLPHVALDLGVAYFNTGQFADARVWLERAYQQGLERFSAAFFLGLTLYRLGEDEAAQPYLAEAKADPDLRPWASYYYGLALLHQGDTAAARAELTLTANEHPTSHAGQAARGYLTGEEVPGEGAPAEGAEKRWHAYGQFNLEYDSNVVAGPSTSPIQPDVSGEADGLVALGAGGQYTFLENGPTSVRGGYDLYQSIHFDLTEFDLQGHGLWLDVASSAGVLQFGVAGHYSFYLLDYQTFYQEGSGTPWVAVNEGETAATQVYYTLRGRDFFRDPFDPARNGVNNAFGVRQYVSLGMPTRVLGLGYQFAAEDTDGPTGNDFQYKGHRWDVGVTLPFGDQTRVRLGYMFTLDNYQFPNSRVNFAFRRHDYAQQVALGVVRDVTDRLALLFDVIAIDNGSNIQDFDYDRQIVSIGVQVNL